MQHARALPKEAGHEERETTPATEERITLSSADRAFPPWAAALTTLFTVARMACAYGVAVLTAFFVSIVAQQGEVNMLAILIAVSAAALGSLIILDFAFIKALAGYRYLREKQDDTAGFMLSVAIFIAMSILHPFAGGAIFAGILTSSAGYFALARLRTQESEWAILPDEAVSLLSGCDGVGVDLARRTPKSPPMARPLHLASLGISAVLAVAIASYLIAEAVMADLALLPVVLISLLSVHSAQGFLARRFLEDPATVESTTAVYATRQGSDHEEEEFGLSIENLTVLRADGAQLLSNLQFSAPPGSITGVIGESGSGKSLLLQALADPYALHRLEVSGHVRLSGQDLWERSSKPHEARVAFLPENPILLPISGKENLTCMGDDTSELRARKILEQLVYSSEIVESIFQTADATLLPRAQAQALAFARSLLIGPTLYLLDRPETALSDKQVSAMVGRLKQETRLGRSIIIATENRALLEICDRLLVLQYGRIIDQGPAELVQERISTGWSRFIGARQLDTEENLLRWVHSHFRRGQETANKRRVSTVASDMLTFSCGTANSGWPGLITFSFKHFEGYCVLRLEDQDAPISSAQFERARQAASDGHIAKEIQPLASVFQNCLEVEKKSQGDSRILEVKIKTFDPRKIKTGAGDDAPAS